MKDRKWRPSTLQRLRAIIGRKETVHFMHISKTGGTAIKTVLQHYRFTHQYMIRLHQHSWTLDDLNQRDKVIFFMRRPVTRFVSSFYSRLRSGRPRYNRPWKGREAVAFGRFKTPAVLAEALSSEDPELKGHAVHAMKSIGHVRSHVLRWVISPTRLLEVEDQILFIGFQERLEHDFKVMCRVLGLPPIIALPSDPVSRHSTPATLDGRVSTLGESNLNSWYRDDLVIYNLCQEIYDRRFAQS